MGRKVVWWVLILIWCALIFSQSAKPAIESSKESGAIVTFANNVIMSVTGVDKPVVTEVVVRKSAHFMEYFIMGVLLFKGLCRKDKLAASMIISILSGALYAASDEFHQYFVPGRAMRLLDFCIDSLAVVIAVLVMYGWSKRKARKEGLIFTR